MLSSCEVMVSMCCPNGGCVLKYLRAGSWESWAAGHQHQLHHWIPQAYFPLYKVGKVHLFREPAAPSTLSACLWGCFMVAARGAGTHRKGGKGDAKWAVPGIFTPRCQEEPTSISSIYWSWAETYTVRKMRASRLGIGLSVREHPHCLEA